MIPHPDCPAELPAATPGSSRRSFLRTAVGGSLLVAGAGKLLSAAPADSKPAALLRQFPCYRAEGTHRELGRQHGEQASAQIAAHLAFMGESMKLGSRELQARARRFRPLFEKHCPHLLEEIAGLAEGARITEAEALAVNIRGALGQAREEGCTAFAIGARGTADGGLLIGQNSDTLPAVVALSYVLHLKPRNKPELLMWTYGGMIGYHGVNRHGVAHFANDLGGGPKSRFGLPHYPLKRLILECRTLDEVVPLFRRTPLWANGNYVLADGTGRILDIEATPDGPEVITDQGAGFLVHTNHFISPRYATRENHAESVPDSFTRQKLMTELIASRLGKATLADVQSYLRSKDRHATGICRVAQTASPSAGWETAGISVASIIAEPTKGKLHVAASNDPGNAFVEYAMS